MKNILLLLAVTALASCSTISTETITSTDVPQRVQLAPATFSDLPSWPLSDEQATGAGRALGASCEKILAKDAQKSLTGGWAGTYADWKPLCQRFVMTSARSGASMQKFFEENFTPHLATNNGDADGLFTGYFVPTLKASLNKTGDFIYPIYTKPTDLISVDLGLFKDEWAGKKLAGQLQKDRLVPYPDRAAIDTHGLTEARVIAYTNDPVGLFFLHIQGSGAVELPDGTRMGVGYDGQNGHSYTAIGKVLMERGELEKGNVTMQSLKEWLATHQDQAASVMHENKSYVFFRRLEGDGVIGAEGTVLTPHHSLAVDKNLMPYGIPLWVDIEHPDKSGNRIQNLMVTQDTGGAIKGAVRGDYFWGSGEEAAHFAGLMQSRGRYWVLLPKAIAR
ncbi:MAG: murein transglycosylase [Alphaproteobacteria bacterium]|nr:murein transglycosylase [Alphaproteobacteria bacterium]